MMVLFRMFVMYQNFKFLKLTASGSVENGKRDDQKHASAQSITARERRRKITVKTRELGSLVPGGTRMKTAEMLHAAYKYVKFMQTQVGLLQLISSFQVMHKLSLHLL